MLFSGLGQYAGITPCDVGFMHNDTTTDTGTNAGGQARQLSTLSSRGNSRQSRRLQGGQGHTRAVSQATVPQPSAEISATSSPSIFNVNLQLGSCFGTMCALMFFTWQIGEADALTEMTIFVGP